MKQEEEDKGGGRRWAGEEVDIKEEEKKGSMGSAPEDYNHF